MNKNAQTLFIFLWILAFLAVLAVGIGQRVSLASKVSLYQTNRVKALAAAQGGINRAIVEILRDADFTCDTVADTWADNEEVFKTVSFGPESVEYAVVSYDLMQEGKTKIVYGVVDEERKININTAPKELLVALFKMYDIKDASLIAENICAWRGDADASTPDYREGGYTNKGKPFATKEEVMLVKGMDRPAYGTVKDCITAYGSGKININTAPVEVVKILITYGEEKLQREGNPNNNAGDLLTKILKLRSERSAFTSIDDLADASLDLTSSQLNILNEIKAVTDVRSNCFYINATGRITKGVVSYPVQCVFDRTTERMLYWHEG